MAATHYKVDKMQPQWLDIINHQSQQSYFLQLQREIAKQRANNQVIFPEPADVFNAFNYLDLPDTKVVILGQDPYHGVGDDELPQAHGLAFSVNHGIKIPPSLRNIYKELSGSIQGFVTPEHGNLVAWSKQGVLLLNTVLTVKKSQAHSHAKLGWQHFTDKIIENININNSGCVFMLWGSHAQSKGDGIDQDKHYVLNAPHPSPLSAYRGFFGCGHFVKSNDWLTKKGKQPIDWSLTK